jgi:hypothetical protein
VTTNGVSASFHYKRKVPKLTKKEMTDTANANVSKLDKDKLVVIGIDPGCHDVAHAATFADDERGSVLSAQLTRGKYYRSSGVTRFNNLTKRWDKPLQSAFARLATLGSSLYTGKLVEITNYCEQYNTIAQEWWDCMLSRKRARHLFRTQGGRKRVLDTFYKTLKHRVEQAHPDKKIVVAYGAATFSPSAKGRISTPTTQVYKACARNFTTYKQNECRTSRQCCFCHGDVESCWKKMRVGLAVDVDGRVAVTSLGHDQCHGAVRPSRNDSACSNQRGLLFCPNCSRYLNRDKSAALNIRFLWMTTRLHGHPMPAAFRARRAQVVG